MSRKILTVAKAILAGAAFGGVIGLAASPSVRSARRNFMHTASGTLRIVGTAMQDVARLIR